MAHAWRYPNRRRRITAPGHIVNRGRASCGEPQRPSADPSGTDATASERDELGAAFEAPVPRDSRLRGPDLTGQAVGLREWAQTAIPVHKAGISGLFKSLIDVLDDDLSSPSPCSSPRRRAASVTRSIDDHMRPPSSSHRPRRRRGLGSPTAPGRAANTSSPATPPARRAPPAMSTSTHRRRRRALTRIARQLGGSPGQQLGRVRPAISGRIDALIVSRLTAASRRR